MIRLIATDMDGTLLDGDKRVSEENAEALAACAARGARVMLASGRSFESLRLFAREMPFACALASCNGARVDAGAFGPTLCERLIPEGASREAYRLLLESGVYFDCYSKNKVYMNNRQPIPGHSRAPHVDTVDGYVQAFVDDPRRMRDEAVGAAYKYVAFCEDVGRLAALREAVEPLGLLISSSWYTNVEIMSPEAGKGRALRDYAAAHGIAKDEIMAFGDNLNDLDMLMEAGFPVAMGNATDELKAAAKLVAPPNDRSGVAWALRKYALEEGEA